MKAIPRGHIRLFEAQCRMVARDDPSSALQADHLVFLEERRPDSERNQQERAHQREAAEGLGARWEPKGPDKAELAKRRTVTAVYEPHAQAVIAVRQHLQVALAEGELTAKVLLEDAGYVLTVQQSRPWLTPYGLDAMQTERLFWPHDRRPFRLGDGREWNEDLEIDGLVLLEEAPFEQWLETNSLAETSSIVSPVSRPSGSGNASDAASTSRHVAGQTAPQHSAATSPLAGQTGNMPSALLKHTIPLERKLYHWLFAEMKMRPDAPFTKEEMRHRAGSDEFGEPEFQRVSGRGFNRAWDKAKEDVGPSDWGRSGRKKKPLH